MELRNVVLIYLLMFSEMCMATSKDNDTTLLEQENNAVCKYNKCIMKCCPTGKVVRRKKKINALCDSYGITRDISDFDEDDTKIFHKKPNMTLFDVKAGIFEANRTFKDHAQNMAGALYFNKYITEDAELMLEIPNAYNRWIRVPNNMFCWDYTRSRNNTLSPGLWVYYQNNKDEYSQTSNVLMTSGMLISCFFLLVVLVVYGLLPELRNLCGMILMAYVASLFVAFLLLAVLRMDTYESGACLGFTLSIYFSFLATFCWMNVMSFDIWWTFRGYAKARMINRRGDRYKFLMYCIYAWGLPLAMTIGLAVLDALDMSHVPWFITPKISTTTTECFITGGEKLLYLYMPMLILILCNWTFYVMTAYNVWRLSRGTAVLESAAAGTHQAHRRNYRRFLVYLKLSIVMGLNWVLEVASFYYPDSSVWFISDFYNIFIGLSIFLIFVCKRKILIKLKKIFMRFKTSQWQPEQAQQSSKGTSTSDNTASVETITLQSSHYPIALRSESAQLNNATSGHPSKS